MPQALPFVRAEINLVWLLPSMTQGPVWKQMEGQCEGVSAEEAQQSLLGALPVRVREGWGGQLGLSIQG